MVSVKKRELTLQEKQEANLSALVEIDRLCRDNNWTYYLTYGTLLGAIRHQGFIPWDDDVDIFMPRKDYDKLIAFMGDDTINGFKLCTRENTKNYPYYIPRFCNMKYRFVTLQDEPEFDIGAFVDIYPLDNYCNDAEAGLKLQKKLSYYNTLYAMYLNKTIGESKIKRIVSRICHAIISTIKDDRFAYEIDNKIMSTLEKHTSDNDIYIGVNCWHCKFRQYERDMFSEIQEISFEGHYFFVPKRYDEILTLIYKDYMKLPSEKERKESHFYEMYIR